MGDIVRLERCGWCAAGEERTMYFMPLIGLDKGKRSVQGRTEMGKSLFQSSEI
jgi:hypothetical protein